MTLPQPVFLLKKRLLIFTRLLLALTASAGFARYWCGRGATEVFEGALTTQQSMGAGVASWVEAAPAIASHSTGNKLFDGEWLFGTYVMSGLGLAQTAMEHPELRARNRPLIRTAVERLLHSDVRAFDERRWREDPIESLAAAASDHAAYLGYFNLLLACQRLIDPQAPSAALHDRISQVLEARLIASPQGLLETYPGECYPLDNAAGIASLALRDRTAHGTISVPVRRWLDAYLIRWQDPQSGLLYQAIDYATGIPRDYPRGSGTNLAVYFLSFADPALSRQLHVSALTSLADTGIGFTAMREYPRGMNGQGDIDSGPLFAGWSISSTGFSLAGCRQQGDADGFTARWRLVHLFGMPSQRAARTHFVTGGRLGDAILFAMATALPPAMLERALAASR